MTAHESLIYATSSKFFKRWLVAVTLCLANIFSNAQVGCAYVYGGQYLPFKTNQLGQAFPVRCISKSTNKYDDKALRVFKNLPPGVSIDTNEEDKFVIKITDRHGKRWAVKLAISALDGSVWASDLDGNGQEDLIIISYTGGCGITPTTQLLFVMFDRQLTPRVYEVCGYFDASKNIIEDLRKAKGRKGAILVEQVLAYERKTEKSYWRTTLWQANQSNWSALSQFDGVRLPAYTLYTFKPPNHKISSLKRQPVVSESELRGSQILPFNPGPKNALGQYFGLE